MWRLGLRGRAQNGGRGGRRLLQNVGRPMGVCACPESGIARGCTSKRRELNRTGKGERVACEPKCVLLRMCAARAHASSRMGGHNNRRRAGASSLRQKGKRKGFGREGGRGNRAWEGRGSKEQGVGRRHRAYGRQRTAGEGRTQRWVERRGGCWGGTGAVIGQRHAIGGGRRGWGAEVEGWGEWGMLRCRRLVCVCVEL